MLWHQDWLLIAARSFKKMYDMLQYTFDVLCFLACNTTWRFWLRHRLWPCGDICSGEDVRSIFWGVTGNVPLSGTFDSCRISFLSRSSMLLGTTFFPWPCDNVISECWSHHVVICVKATTLMISSVQDRIEFLSSSGILCWLRNDAYVW